MKRVNIETPEKDVYRFTFEADAQELENAVQAVYLRNRDQIQIPGFEKGQADRAAIEKEKGSSVFWYEAINDCMAAEVPELVEQTVAELGLEPVTETAYELLYASAEKGFSVTATLVNAPEITLERYTGFTTKCKPNPLGVHDVDHFIQRRRMMLAKKVEQSGPAAKGMTAVLDYEGFLGGIAFEGGKAEGQPIELGSGRMIPGFEEGILGHCPGEEFEIHVTFPTAYPEQELAGKPAVFRAKLTELYLRKIPELDDAFAKQAGGVDTLDAYKEQVRLKLEDLRVDNAMNRARTDIVRQLGKYSTGSLPDLLTEDAYQAQLEQLRQQLGMVRKSLEDYLAETRTTMEQLSRRLRTAAEEQARVHLALLKVAKLEGLEPTDAEVDAEIARQAERLGCTSEEYAQQNDRRTVQHGLCAMRAAEFVVEHSTIVQEN